MRKNRAKFKVRLYHPEYIIIEDIGTDHKSVTNDAENGKFKGFKFGGPDD